MGVGKREVQEGGDICILIIDSLHCTAETKTILESNYTQIKKKILYSLEQKYMCAKSLQSSVTLCDLMDCSPPRSSVHGILQARILEWVAMPSSRGCSRPRDRTCVSSVSCIDRWVLYH